MREALHQTRLTAHPEQLSNRSWMCTVCEEHRSDCLYGGGVDLSDWGVTTFAYKSDNIFVQIVDSSVRVEIPKESRISVEKALHAIAR